MDYVNQYNFDKFLFSINPITKLIGVFSFALSTMLYPNYKLGVILLIILLVIAAISKNLRNLFKIIFGFGIPFILMLVFIQGFYNPDNITVLYDFGFATLGLEGTLYAAKISVTVLVFLISFYLMNKTTKMSELVASITQSGIPKQFGYLILSSLNVVPEMQRRLNIIQDAQKSRGVKTGGNIIQRIKAFVPLIGPVVMSSLTDAQERGMTLETRGFGVSGVQATTYIQVKMTLFDKILNILFSVFLLAVFVFSFIL